MLSGEKYTNARIRTKNTFRTFFTIYICGIESARTAAVCDIFVADLGNVKELGNFR